MKNITLIEINTTYDSDGKTTAKLFSFLFPDGTHSTVGLQEQDFDIDEETQKQIAAETANKDVAKFIQMNEKKVLNETINLY